MSSRCQICRGKSLPSCVVEGICYRRCLECGHLFLWPLRQADGFERYYEDGTYYDRAARQEARLRRDALTRCALLEQMCAGDATGRLLDVGCATGVFLRTARDCGWDVEGIELSPATAEVARKGYGLVVHETALEGSGIPVASFDVVTAWEVIEHVPDPAAFLDAAARIVRPGGLLALSTPLADGLAAKLLGRHNPFLLPLEHLSLFSRRSLELLTGRSGLKEIHFETFSNLDASALTRGVERLLLGRLPTSTRGLLHPFARLFALGISPGPWVLDRMKQGTEMLVVYRRG